MAMIVGGRKIIKIEFQTAELVPTNTETTVLSFTNIGSRLFIDGVGGAGTARSEWFVYLDTVLIAKRRMSVGTPFIELKFDGLPVETGSIIDVKVKQYEAATQEFESEVRYYR